MLIALFFLIFFVLIVSSWQNFLADLISHHTYNLTTIGRIFMKISTMNWMQVETYLQQDDRCILPLGSTEQHAYLSLSVDSILAEKMALDTSADSGIPVFPVLAYGITPLFMAYQGTMSLKLSTYFAIIDDILSGLVAQGFRRILIVNGHGGNSPASSYVSEWQMQHPQVRIKWHDWWRAPKTMKQVRKIDSVASHASWMENFPWTRLDGIVLPDRQKPMVDFDLLRQLSAQELRNYLGDGNFGGVYQRSDDDMQKIWDVAIAETQTLLHEGWVE